MKYTILKPVYLGGKKRLIGEMIDESLIEKTRVWALKRSGFIAEVGNLNREDISIHTAKEVPREQNIIVPVHIDNTIQELSIKPKNLSIALSIIQTDTKKALEQINHLKSEEALIVINAIDNRKTIKEAAAVAAKKLNQRNMESSEE